MSPPQMRGRRLRPDERRSHLLEVTAQLLTDGSSDASIPDVADAAGVSKNLVYTYFGNRSGLLLALLDETADRFDAEVRVRLRDLEGGDDWLHVSTTVYFDAVEALGPVFVALFQTHHGEEAVDERRRERQHEHVEAVAQLLRRETEADAASCEAHATVLLAALNAAAELVVRGRCTRTEGQELYLAMARPAVEHLRG